MHWPSVAEVLESCFSSCDLIQVETHKSLHPASFWSNGMQNSLLMSLEKTFSDSVMHYISYYIDKKEKHKTNTLFSHNPQIRPPRGML